MAFQTEVPIEDLSVLAFKVLFYGLFDAFPVQAVRIF